VNYPLVDCARGFYYNDLVYFGTGIMKEIRQEMQAFYLQHNVIEYALTFEQACNFMRSLSLKLQEAARLNKDLTILFVTTQTVEESTIYQNVLCQRAAFPLEVKITEKKFTSCQRNDFDKDEIATTYFDV